MHLRLHGRLKLIRTALRENLLVQFSLAAFLVLAAVAVGTAALLTYEIRQSAIEDLEQEAVGSTLDRVLYELGPADLAKPMRGASYTAFDEFVRGQIQTSRTARIKLYSPDGTILYSTDPDEVGQQVPNNPSLASALGGINANEVSMAALAPGVSDRYHNSILHVYTPLQFPGEAQPGAVLEIQQYYGSTGNHILRLQTQTVQVVSSGFVLLYATLVTVVAGGWNTIKDQRRSLDSANTSLTDANTELAGAKSRLSRVLNTAGEGILEVDRGGEIRFANPAAAQLIGMTTDELKDVHHARLLHTSHRPNEDQCPICRVLESGRVFHEEGLHLLRPDGSQPLIQYTASPMREDHQLTGAVLVFSDITSRVQAQQALRASQRTLSTLMSNLPGMAYRCRNNRRWEMEFVSEGALELTGYAPTALTDESGPDYADLIHPDDQENVWVEVQAAVRSDRPFQLTYRIFTAEGKLRWVWEQGRAVADPLSDGGIALEGFITDITERVELEGQLQHDAFHDGLTRLPNRALFMDRLRQALQRNRRHPRDGFAVVFLDLDRFKVINDSLGHVEGDQVLVETARRLEACVREVDTVARLGGDEFGLLLAEVNEPSAATRVADRVLQSLAKAFTLGNKQVFVSGSIGLAFSSTGYERAEDILRDADLAMYRAKGEGKNRYAIFDVQMHERALARLDLETDLRLAVDRDEFRLHYQPIVNLSDGKVIGFEALLRWQHPQRGLLLPADFLSAAEETGLMVSIGTWVMREAARQAAAWRHTTTPFGSARISINLAESQFAQLDLPSTIEAALDDAGIPANWLALEITESVAMDAARDPLATLQRLRQLGVQLHMDDFGTGFSSLAMLHEFPIDVLKIDRSFIDRLEADSRQRSFVEAILLLADRLGLEVIAEGVETPGQAEVLAELGCRQAQGFHFGRAQPPQAALQQMMQVAKGAAAD